MIEGRFPTVINKEVNLASNPKQCCPFHKEDTPSFSYNIKTGRWFCFGKCHCGGDVIDMHQRWFHFDTRADAENDLNSKCGVQKIRTLESVAAQSNVYVSEDNVENESTYVQAVSMANTPKRWLELDYVMSKSPYDRLAVLDLIIQWKSELGLLE